VYQLKLPQQPTYPAVLVTLFEDPATYQFRGPVNFWRAGVQIDAFANEYDATRPDPYDTVEQLAEAIDQALSGVRFTVDTIRVTGSFRGPLPARVPAYDPGELRIARILQEYRLVYRRTDLVTSKTPRPEEQKTGGQHAGRDRRLLRG
jgi:hypothetical protein